MEKKLFTRDFTLVVIGQIISLFGNAAIRFALPLYLLNQTGSSALYGTVMACAMVPSVLLSPVGGLIADRVNKRNVMVILDFSTAGLVCLFMLLMGHMNLVLVLTVTLMLLYGIAGAYQPTVQASVPALVGQEQFMRANAVINVISSFASMLGPVLGGILYSAYGLIPVLEVCIVSFVLSAVMEIFIRIPYQRQESQGSILQTARQDLGESVRFIYKDNPLIGQGILVVCGINLFLSAMIIVGLPYLITEVLPFTAMQANRLYGYAQGALAAGGIIGGIGAGVLADKLQVTKVGNLLIAGAVCVFPIGLALLWTDSGMVVYVTITICCFVIMSISTVFSVQIISFVQTQTPQNLIGKVIAVAMMASMCAQPLGNAMYGFLFELCKGWEAAVVLFAGMVSLVIAVGARKLFMKL
ncbi:MAG: MFS transporter [Lachnospiraceae bacterium]|nr:MFS transporter [Lachnospiraceae bacterium]